MPKDSAQPTDPARIEPQDRHFVPISKEVYHHYLAGRLRDHPCPEPVPQMLICPHDGCSRLVVCKSCGHVILIMLPSEGGWCEVAEAERQWQTTP